MTERRAFLLLLLVILFWAGNFPLGKLALDELGPVALTAGRALVAAPLLLLVARFTAPLAHPLARRDYLAFVVLGLTGLVGNTTLWYWGLKHTTALNAGILGAASPIFVALTAALLLGDRLGPKGSLETLRTLAVNRGDLVILCSQVLWVAYSLFSRASASALPPVWVMAGANVVSALVLIPLAAAVEPWRSPRAAPLGWGVILYGAVLVTLAHVWYYAIVRTLGPGRAAGFLNLMPFVVLGLAWLLVGEAIHAYHLIGAALVIAGVFLTMRRIG